MQGFAHHKADDKAALPGTVLDLVLDLKGALHLERCGATSKCRWRIGVRRACGKTLQPLAESCQVDCDIKYLVEAVAGDMLLAIHA